MRVKKWRLLIGLGVAIFLICCVSTCAIIVYVSKDAVSARWETQAQFCYDAGEYEKAVKWYDLASKISPEEMRIHYGKGAALYELGRYEDAVESYDRALELYPDNVQAYKGKANALAGLGRSVEAVEAYGDALAREPNLSFEDLCDTGRRRFEEEGYAEAIAYFKAAAKLAPYDCNVLYTIGLAWLALEQYEEAASYFGAVSEFAPGYAPGWERKGWALAMAGRYETALECYNRALALDARDARTWTSVGKVLLFIGEAEAARECFDCALALESDLADVWTLKGAASYMLGEYGEARAILEEYPELSPSKHTLLYLYVVEETCGGRGSERLQTLLEFPSDIWAKDVSLFLVGRISAEDLLAEAAEDEVKLCEAHYYIGYERKVDGDAAGARFHFEDALATGERQCLEYALARYELRRCGFMRGPSVSAAKLAALSALRRGAQGRPREGWPNTRRR